MDDSEKKLQNVERRKETSLLSCQGRSVEISAVE